ncbi:MAG: hypothetical protein OQL16_13965 [Gammaproteobacteria bacterium]|nr:hypothetical protein [Gammaproteobacteria bacterium]
MHQLFQYCHTVRLFWQHDVLPTPLRRPASRDIRPPWMAEVSILQEHLSTRPSMGIVAPARPCARDIPVILTIAASASCLSRHTVHPWT